MYGIIHHQTYLALGRGSVTSLSRFGGDEDDERVCCDMMVSGEAAYRRAVMVVCVPDMFETAGVAMMMSGRFELRPLRPLREIRVAVEIGRGSE